MMQQESQGGHAGARPASFYCRIFSPLHLIPGTFRSAGGGSGNMTVAQEMAAGYEAYVAAEAEAEALAHRRREQRVAAAAGAVDAPAEQTHARAGNSSGVVVPHDATAAAAAGGGGGGTPSAARIPSPSPPLPPPASPLAPSARNLRRLAGRREAAAQRNAGLKNTSLPQFGESGWVDSSGGGGSCQCYCPPVQGFGACKQLPAGADPATACQVETVQPVQCPAVGARSAPIPLQYLPDPCPFLRARNQNHAG